MAAHCERLNVLKVINDSKSSDIDSETLKEILHEKGIDPLISQCDDGWLINIDCSALEGNINLILYFIPKQITDEVRLVDILKK